MITPELEKSLHRALALATERRHEYATVEHLLLSLTEDQDAIAVLRACNVHLDRLRRELLNYVDNELGNLVISHSEDAKPTASFQRVLQRAAIHVQSSGREDVTGANVLLAMFAEGASHAVYFLQEQDMTRLDALNYISHGIAKAPGRSEPEQDLVSEPEQDLQAIGTLAVEQADSFLTARNGRIDLAPTTGDFDRIVPRIDAARVAVTNLKALCAVGNNQHPALGGYTDQYRSELDKLAPSSSSLMWYVIAQQIENYRSNYMAVSILDPGEYPPLEPRLSTAIDTVVLATGMLARLFPEIASSQDDFRKYAGEQVGVRHAERELLDATLSDLAASKDVLTPAAAAAAGTIAGLDPGATPSNAPEATRTLGTKTGFLRSFFGTISKIVLDQQQNLRDNIRTKGIYDLSKEIIKSLTLGGFGGILGYLASQVPALLDLAHAWPALFDFIPSLLRILGLH